MEQQNHYRMVQTLKSTYWQDMRDYWASHKMGQKPVCKHKYLYEGSNHCQICDKVKCSNSECGKWKDVDYCAFCDVCHDSGEDFPWFCDWPCFQKVTGVSSGTLCNNHDEQSDSEYYE